VPRSRGGGEAAAGLAAGAGGLPARLACSLIGLYRRFVSPMLPPACRFAPTCSEYALTAIRRHGLARGGWLALRRILRCNPWHPGGFDPVP